MSLPLKIGYDNRVWGQFYLPVQKSMRLELWKRHRLSNQQNLPCNVQRKWNRT